MKRYPRGESPQDVHRQHAFPAGARCSGCKSPKVAVRARVFLPVDRALKDYAQLMMQMAEMNGGSLPVIDMYDSSTKNTHKYVRISDIFACDFCKGSMARAAAHGPSDALVHIDTGPTDRTMIQVPGLITPPA